jgi:hypothetical protein
LVRKGYKVARIDRKTRAVSDFIVHTPPNDDSVIFVPNGFCRPIDVHFRGPEMFIVDFGSANRNPPVSGKIWKVTHQ